MSSTSLIAVRLSMQDQVLNTGAGTYRAYDKDTAVVFGSTTRGVRG